jgi:hypothetical protein
MGNIIETDVNKSDEYKGRSVKEKKKGREILIALVFMFLFLMFSGCIFRSEANLGSTMLLRGIEQQDIDQDGKTDIYIATFSDSKINAGNATIFLTRSIYAYPTQIVINPKTFIVDSAELNFIKESSIKINEDIVKADASCRAVFEPALCNDKQSCENSCLTRDCKEKGYGLLLLDYTDLMRKRDEQLRALLLLAQTLREGDSVKEISSRLTQ